MPPQITAVLEYLGRNFDPIATLMMFLTLAAGISAALCFVPQLASKILSFDGDGRRLAAAGMIVGLTAFLVPDYTASHVILGLGELFLITGIWIALPDDKTKGWVNSSAFNWYLIIFVAWVLIGTFSAPRSIDLAIYYLVRLIIPIVVSALFGVLILLSFASVRFKKEVLALDTEGSKLANIGFVPLALTLIVGANPAWVIALGTLGSFLIALGGLIAAEDEITNFLLQRRWSIAYAIVVVLTLAMSRSTF